MIGTISNLILEQSIIGLVVLQFQIKAYRRRNDIMQLYESGKLVGTIQQFEFRPGQKEVFDVPALGGMYYAQGRKELDVVTFQLPFFHEGDGIHELVDESGNVIEIDFLNISSFNNTSFVRAYVQSIRKS
ncbi:MAG: hypothetical protein CVV24_11925 [Ignavibacteriae bacterium HGW-Ignavibacteriae-3]|nr:MAG: hypothetical protein CVV24_11925 [Ignavibacteriae bacterium HGW-Ignavibacteriae-3]